MSIGSLLFSCFKVNHALHRVIDYTTIHHGQDGMEITDITYRDRHVITIDDHQIGQLSDFPVIPAGLPYA